jgi:D-alanyl-D-alanine carboxypeptidase (penicillin-binding protein 5/6)
MAITASQKFWLSLVRLFVAPIWVLDVALRYDPSRIIKRLQYAFLLVVGVGVFTFLGYAYTTNFLSKLADGFYSQQYAQFSQTSLSEAATALVVKNNFPVLIGKTAAPEITATSALVVDRKSQKVLYALNASSKVAPASTTKLMTALVALDLYNMTDALQVPAQCTKVASTKANLPANAEFKAKDILYTMLVASAGDAACVLASDKVSMPQFVNLMNQKAQKLGLSQTHFSNPIGLDSAGGDQYSTAADLYKLATTATENPMIKDIVQTKTFELTALASAFSKNNSAFTETVSSTNKLLWDIPGSVGVKTGTTQDAGEVLIYEYATEPEDIVIVVMESKDRFNDTKALLAWTLASYKWN